MRSAYLSNGTVANGITFRGWDQTSGIVGGVEFGVQGGHAVPERLPLAGQQCAGEGRACRVIGRQRRVTGKDDQGFGREERGQVVLVQDGRPAAGKRRG